MEIMGHKILLQLPILLFIITTPNVFAKSLEIVTSPRTSMDQNASSTNFPEAAITNSLPIHVDSESDSDEDEAGFDETIISEICDEFLLHDVSATSAQPPLPKVGHKITQKERLLCALLKIEVKKLNRKHTKAAEVKDTAEEFPLPKGYNKKAAPLISIGVKSVNGTDINVQGPVQLYIFINIRSVSDINEDKEEVTLDMHIYLMWVDGEILKGIQDRNITLDKLGSTESDDNFRPIPPGLEGKLWTPDISIEELVQVNTPVLLDKKDSDMFFNPKLGAVIIANRFFATLVCNMDLFYYPADRQRCPFNLRSGYHTTKELNIEWWNRNGNGVYLQETSDPNFDARVASISKVDRPINIGPESRQGRNASFLMFEIYIRRKMTYHLVQTYLPSVFFIIVTWLCFLIPARMLEIRIGITMTTLLTLTSMFSSVRENTTVVSYVKAIDIWMVTCIFFIFVVLFAFTCEAWIRAARKRLQTEKDNLDKCRTKTFKIVQAYKAIEDCIESYAAMALFTSFLVFNITYWCWLLLGAEYFNWDVDERFNNVTN